MYNETWMPLRKEEVIHGEPEMQKHPLANPFPGVVVGLVKLLLSQRTFVFSNLLFVLLAIKPLEKLVYTGTCAS